MIRATVSRLPRRLPGDKATPERHRRREPSPSPGSADRGSRRVCTVSSLAESLGADEHHQQPQIISHAAPQPSPKPVLSHSPAILERPAPGRPGSSAHCLGGLRDDVQQNVALLRAENTRPSTASTGAASTFMSLASARSQFTRARERAVDGSDVREATQRRIYR